MKQPSRTLTRDRFLTEMCALGIYSTEQWQEYLSFFGIDRPAHYRDPELTPACCEIRRRIVQGESAPPTPVDTPLSVKIVRGDSAANILNARGVRLGVVSGCFDLLHLGHVKGLAYAGAYLENRQNAALCVLVQSDAGIAESKGAGRPILNIDERLRLLTGLRCTEYVVVLDDPNCLRLLSELPVGWFFKSANDLDRGVVREETAVVRRHGGKLCIFPEEVSNIVSTTEIVRRIRTADVRTGTAND